MIFYIQFKQTKILHIFNVLSDHMTLPWDVLLSSIQGSQLKKNPD